MGIRSGRLAGFVNCCAHARLDGSWLGMDMFMDPADEMCSGVVMVSVNSSGVVETQED